MSRNHPAARLLSTDVSTPRRPLAKLLAAALLCALVLGAVGAAGAASAGAGETAGAGTHRAGGARASSARRGRAARHAKGAHRARVASYLSGLGDEQATMFANPLWKQLKTKIVRYVVPYDAVAHSWSLDQAIDFIRAAEAAHQQVLVAFYHSEYSPTRLPSVPAYKRDVQRFIKLFPHVRQYESWDESNRGNEPPLFTSPSAVQAAKYYQALIRVCRRCTVVGLDVLDAYYIQPTLRYIAEFKREIYRLETVMPKVWGLHNYSDVNRLEGWRTTDLVRALGGKVWLTETGGIVKFGGSFPNKHGSGLRRSAKVLKFMFKVAGEHPQIKRIYIYDWNGGTASTRFDAGLTNAREQPREGYVVVCRRLRGARCGVKVARN
ncbi:MAG TPA: hypothetical protein VL979_09785 [Solirubrobacteraceae bacterium]|nr:hypothetical protein [Solirubrobacteraceae bacterium]